MVLLMVSLCFVGYIGLVVYKSIDNRPMKVRITNITDSAATITWVTNNPVHGVVYYSEKNNVLSGPLGFLAGNRGYDDRDFATAQEECVDSFNENAKNTKNANFAVNGSSFDCENIKVEKLGAYYTHSITLKNLKEATTYYFKVGNGIWSWGVKGVGSELSTNDLPIAGEFDFTTGNISSVVPVPNLAYGTVSAGIKSEEGYLSEDLSKDSLVFAYVTIDNVDSQLISTVTNSTGGWLFDKSNFRNTGGDVITDLSNASMVVCAQYEDVDPKDCSVVSDLSEDTKLELLGNSETDMTSYQKSKILEKFEELVSKVYAYSDCTDSNHCTNYDLNRCTNDGSVSSCAENADCIKKCPIKGTDMYDWVKYGTVGGGNCKLPSYCGNCTATDSAKGCINAVANDNYSTKCENTTGGYFWKKYTTDNCTVAAGNENCNDVCTYSDFAAENGCPTDCKGYCPDTVDRKVRADNEKCSNDKYCDGNKRTCSRSEPSSENVCTSKADYTSCNIGGNVGRCLDENCDLFKGDPCPDPVEGPKTGVFDANGKCIATCKHEGDSCNTEGGDVGMCNDNLVCISLNMGKVCTIDGNAGTYDGNGKCIVVENISQCKVIPVYDDNEKKDGQGKFYYQLKNCIISCTDLNAPKTLYPNTCLSYFPNISEKKYLESGHVYSEGVSVEYVPIDVETIYFNDWNSVSILLGSDPTGALKSQFKASVKAFTDLYDGSKCGKPSDEKVKQKKALCGGICNNGSSWKETRNEDITCIDPSDNSNYHPVKYSCTCSAMSLFAFPNLGNKVFAEENSGSDEPSYSFYLPEAGLYNFQLAGYTILEKIADGNTTYSFYIESNGITGFQMPADPANPTSSEDIVLSTSAYKITYTQETSALQYNIKEGINIISFNFIATNTNSQAYTAEDIINQALDNGVTIQYITTYDSGRWSSGYSCKDGLCVGNNFAIVPGKGYLIYATQGGNIIIPGYKLTSPIPIAFSAGWNLVGVNGYTTAYTARSFIDSINQISGLVANNISWWPTSKSKYEGLQVDNGVQYGTDFSISPTNGYFVRISSFAPSNATCKTIIWQPGGSLNGECGNTK